MSPEGQQGRRSRADVQRNRAARLELERFAAFTSTPTLEEVVELNRSLHR